MAISVSKLQRGFKVGGKSVSSTAICNYFDAIWLRANSYFEQEILPDWAANDRLYRDVYPMANKLGWQSQLETPAVDVLVTRITQFFARILTTRQEDFFVVNHDDPNKREGYKEVLKTIIRDNKYAEQIFPKALGVSWINAIYAVKVLWESEEKTYPVPNDAGGLDIETEIKSKVKARCVEPRNIRLDPDGEEYIIECCPNVPLATFMSMGKANGWINLDRVQDDTLGGVITPEVQAVEDEPKSNHLPTVDLHYVYCKNITDERGQTLCKDMSFVIVNKQWVVSLKKNELPNGQFPYAIHNPMMDVFGVYGRPYISKLRSLIIEYTNMVNLMLDAAKLAGLGLHEINREVLENASAQTFTADLEPGKYVIKRGEGKAIESSFPGTNSLAMLLQVVYYLDREIQNKSYQSEFFSGQATSKGRPTLGEVNLKSETNNAFFTDIANQIEDNAISVTLDLMLKTYLINMDDKTMHDLLGNISDETIRAKMQNLPYAERLKDIRELRIEVRGMSGKLQRQNSFNKIIQLLSVAGNFPGVLSATVMSKLLEKGMDTIDDTADSIFNMDMLRAAEEQLAQAAGQPPTQGGQQPAGTPGQQPDPSGAVQKQVADTSGV